MNSRIWLASFVFCCMARVSFQVLELQNRTLLDEKFKVQPSKYKLELDLGARGYTGTVTIVTTLKRLKKFNWLIVLDAANTIEFDKISVEEKRGEYKIIRCYRDPDLNKIGILFYPRYNLSVMLSFTIRLKFRNEYVRLETGHGLYWRAAGADGQKVAVLDLTAPGVPHRIFPCIDDNETKTTMALNITSRLNPNLRLVSNLPRDICLNGYELDPPGTKYAKVNSIVAVLGQFVNRLAGHQKENDIFGLHALALGDQVAQTTIKVLERLYARMQQLARTRFTTGSVELVVLAPETELLHDAPPIHGRGVVVGTAHSLLLSSIDFSGQSDAGIAQLFDLAEMVAHQLFGSGYNSWGEWSWPAESAIAYLATWAVFDEFPVARLQEHHYFQIWSRALDFNMFFPKYAPIVLTNRPPDRPFMTRDLRNARFAKAAITWFNLGRVLNNSMLGEAVLNRWFKSSADTTSTNYYPPMEKFEIAMRITVRNKSRGQNLMQALAEYAQKPLFM